MVPVLLPGNTPTPFGTKAWAVQTAVISLHRIPGPQGRTGAGARSSVGSSLNEDDRASSLTARERDVLALMAEGRSNGAIAGILVVSERAVEKHVGNIFSKLGLAPSDADHRRVLAVLRYLES